MIAERAWSYAMQLRQEANTEPRKKFHLISRLRKATVNALQLQTLCEVTFMFLYKLWLYKIAVFWIIVHIVWEVQSSGWLP